jgi:hypothetical protein
LLLQAEALYRLTRFEHALLLFYRAQRLFPESAEFRLGVQKSLETINALIFKLGLFAHVEELIQAYR